MKLKWLLVLAYILTLIGCSSNDIKKDPNIIEIQKSEYQKLIDDVKMIELKEKRTINEYKKIMGEKAKIIEDLNKEIEILKIKVKRAQQAYKDFEAERVQNTTK